MNECPDQLGDGCLVTDCFAQSARSSLIQGESASVSELLLSVWHRKLCTSVGTSGVGRRRSMGT